MSVKNKVAKGLLKSGKVKIKNNTENLITLRMNDRYYVINPDHTVKADGIEFTPEVKRLLRDKIIEIE